MDAKEYLNRYKKLTATIKRIDREIEHIEDEIDSITIDNDGMPKGTDMTDRTGNLASRLADYRSKQEVIRLQAWKEREDIINMIHQLRDPIQAQLLFSRYIECKRWEDVAGDIERSEYWTRSHLHASALKSFGDLLVVAVDSDV